MASDGPKPHIVRLESAGAGSNELVDAFNDWSSILTNRSIETAFAVIGANWAVYGAAEVIISNLWSRWSVAAAIAFLGANLIGTWVMAKLHFDQARYAAGDHGRWEREFNDAKATNTDDPWPYTARIESLGKLLRFLKAWAPSLAAVLFLVSLAR